MFLIIFLSSMNSFQDMYTRDRSLDALLSILPPTLFSQFFFYLFLFFNIPFLLSALFRNFSSFSNLSTCILYYWWQKFLLLNITHSTALGVYCKYCFIEFTSLSKLLIMIFIITIHFYSVLFLKIFLTFYFLFLF